MPGWIKLHRSIRDHIIYRMPPLYLRVFERLILEANHQDAAIPFKSSGEKVMGTKLIKRGERQTSIRAISEWVAWYEYGILKTPNTKTIKEILDWLVENEMITIFPREGNRDGTHYKVVNYNSYQGSEGEEVTVKKQLSNSKVTVTGSKQECIKNDKEKSIAQKPARAHIFEDLWKLYPEKKGKGRVSEKAKKEIEKIGLEKIKLAIDRYKADIEKQRNNGFPERQYMHGGRFFTSGFQDYLDDPAEEVAQDPRAGLTNEKIIKMMEERLHDSHRSDSKRS